MGSVTALTTLHFDIVGSCQLRCVGCPNSTIAEAVSHIDPAVFAACLAHIDVERVEVFRLFNYGEPLLHPDLPAIFDVLASAPAFTIRHLELSTNAQFVRWDQLEDVLRRRQLNRLVVSCDGDGTRGSYERLRPPARWDKLVAFLARARELRDQYAPEMELMTRTVIFDETDMTRWRAVLEPLGWRPEFRRWITLVGGAENLSGHSVRPGHGRCPFVGAPVSAYVDATGTVVPCCAHPHAGNFGSLQTMRWSAIFEGAARRAFLDRLENDRASLATCATCEFGAESDFAEYAVAGQSYA